MIISNFINKINNKIKIKIQNYKGIGINNKNKTKHNFNGVKIIMIGPTSEMTNEITYKEAEELYKCLGKYLKNNK